MYMNLFNIRWPVVTVVLLSAMGIWISGELVTQHVDLWAGENASAGLFASVCFAAEPLGLNCSRTIQGDWSSVSIPIVKPSISQGLSLHTLDVPVAFLGLSYFVFIAVWFAFVGGPRPAGRRWEIVPLSVIGIGAAASVLFLALMAFGEAPWCVWCLATHAVNFLIVLIVWRLWRKSSRTRAAVTATSVTHRSTLTPREAFSAIAFSCILIAGSWVYFHDHVVMRGHWNKLRSYRKTVEKLQADPDFLVREFLAQPQHQIGPQTGSPTDADRPRLVVFSDIECPSCYCNWLTVKNRCVEAFEGNLIVEVRHYPLSSDCNDKVTELFHPNACSAAYAEEAARLQGGDEAWARMHDLLFQHREDLGIATYRALAEEMGLDPDQLQRDMEEPAVRNRVHSDVKLAHRLGVKKTPTMFLNGRQVTALCQVPLFWYTIGDLWSTPHTDSLSCVHTDIEKLMAEAILNTSRRTDLP
jgi:predicted DsbA family dithiol-disulfide isomerase